MSWTPLPFESFTTSPRSGLGPAIDSTLNNPFTMKTTKTDLANQLRACELRVEPLEMSLCDMVRGNVHWFGHCNARFRLGISRPNGPAGGFVIVQRETTVSAYYWEQFSRDALAHIALCVTGEDTAHNRALIAERETIEAASKWVSEHQNDGRI